MRATNGITIESTIHILYIFIIVVIFYLGVHVVIEFFERKKKVHAFFSGWMVNRNNLNVYAILLSLHVSTKTILINIMKPSKLLRLPRI